jgi:signal transduction histidine kinase
MPIAVSFVGIAYILFEDVVLQRHPISDPSVLRTLLVIGLAGPTLVWITLTWAANAALAEAEAQRKLVLRSEEARRRAAYLQIASQVGQRMTALLDLHSLLAELVQLIRQKFGYEFVHVLLFDEETNELTLQEASGPGAESLKASGLVVKVGEEGITGWVAHTGRSLVCNDVEHDPRYLAAGQRLGIKSELAVPLRVRNRIVGVLDIQRNRLDGFDKEDLTVLEILGSQMGTAIENARLFQETRRRYEAMVALHDTSLDIISELNMGVLLEALLRRGAQLLGAQAGSLWLYDSGQGLVRNMANYNTVRDWSGSTLRTGEGVSGQVILTGSPLIVNDYSGWSGKVEQFDGTHLNRVIGVPIRRQHEAIGVILVFNEAGGRPFDRDDLWLLNQFADLVSLAIENAKLHTQVKTFSQHLERSVEERTLELYRAKEEIAAKADQLRSLLAKTIHIQEEERARISRDMHDGVVQLIAAARFELQAAKVFGGSELGAAVQSKLSAARGDLEEAETEIRRAIYDLHSPILDTMGVVPALERHVAKIEVLTGIACTMDVKGTTLRLPRPIEVAVYRIVEEALNNVAAHAGSKTAAVHLEFGPNTFCVTVEDNGHGFDYGDWIKKHHGQHLGLIGMKERVNSLDGEMQVWSELNKGTRIHFRVPIPEEE